MTPPPKRRHNWSDWGRIRKLLTEQGEFSTADADKERKGAGEKSG
jgi:hypothetical protein